MDEQVTLQKALFSIKKLKQMLQEQKKNALQPIAIIGMSCRFPQAVGKQGYWQMLCEGRNIIAKMPEARWELLKGTHEAALRDPTFPYWGGFLTDIAAFDAYFFGISPREAARIDPQHRLLLEVAYEAFEDAGLPVETLAGSNTGVFSSLYVSQLMHMQHMDSEMDALYLPTGNAISIAANRLSYLFDLHGPSVIIDSACSSSMTSLHLACLNLLNKTCDLAIVCGAKLNLLPYVNFVLTKAKMLSIDGQCKTFDASANGYVQGEGVGAVVLKPLDKALQNKDRIYAVITGSAVNQDGKTNGLTAPNGLQQEALLKTVYKYANTDPQHISYVECHGTGTFLGDPIEVQALGEVIGKKRDRDKPCWIGSVKTNIGHLEPAAGIASIIKVALALHHQQIPPHLNLTTPNPHIAFEKYHFQVPQKMESWPKYGSHRIAGISGFGFGGTNSHVVMRELDNEEKSIINQNVPAKIALFTLSAKDPIALGHYINKWITFLSENESVDLAQICYCTHVKRSHYLCRLAVIANTTRELSDALKLIKNKSLETISSSDKIFINLKNEKKGQAIKLDKPIHEYSLSTLATAYVSGTSIDWKKFEEERSYHHMDLPCYPWQHKDYWPPLINNQAQISHTNPYPLQGKFLSSPLNPLQFEFIVDKQHMPDLQDTYNVVHAGYYMEIFAFIAQQLRQQSTFTIEDHEFLSPLFMLNDVSINIQVILVKTAEEKFQYDFYSNTRGQQNWAHHARGKIYFTADTAVHIDDVNHIKKQSYLNEPSEKLYERILAMGMPAGESIRWTNHYWLGENQILCEFVQPQSTIEKNELFTLKIHPSIIDASIQPIFKLLPPEMVKPYIAAGVKRAAFYGIKKGPYYLHGMLTNLNKTSEQITANCFLINFKNEIIAEFESITLAQLDNRIQIEKMVNAGEKHVKIDLATLPVHERKQYVINFLLQQIAIIFSMPEHDIHINSSLRDLGIDSLMAIVLMRTLEMGLGINYSIQALLEGPTIEEIVEFVVNSTETQISNTTNQVIAAIEEKKPNPWIAFRKPLSNAKYRLFCFPYGGGGASIYRDWQEALSHPIEVCPIQLPGREGRLNEKPIGDIKKLVDLLMENLQDEFNLPFAFFGHSFGALIAFELTRTLRKQNLPQPIHLFASAFPDPRTPTKSLDMILKQLKDINVNLFDCHQPAFIASLSDETLARVSAIFNENGIDEYGDHLLNKEITKVLLPIFSGDMGIVKSYEYYDDACLDLPITVFAGKQDTWVSYEDHLQWGDHTLQECTIHAFESGHLFINQNEIRLSVINKIREELLRN